MDANIDNVAAIGLAALPGILAGILAALRPLLLQRFTSDVIPPLALLFGVGLAFIAAAGDAIAYSNPFSLLLVGLTIGLAAIGMNSAQAHYRNRGPSSRGGSGG